MTVEQRPASARLSDRLYDLLPAIYRIRDAEQGLPLQALLDVIAEQVAVLEEDLAQLYDDQFVETCAEWVVPYIGNLVGARGINDPTGRSPAFSERALVADTLRLRRRKGTAAVLEQLAHDVTNWDARVVEFFQLLATNQYLNRLRPENRAFPDLRDVAALESIGTPFDTVPRTVDVRNIASGRGKYNLPNVGIFLWRLRVYSRTDAPATRVDGRRYLFGPAGGDIPLFNRPETEVGIDRLAERVNVPMPLGRRLLDRDFPTYYGPNRSLALTVDGRAIPAAEIVVCDLRDVGTGWARQLSQGFGVDPELGRIVTPTGSPVPTSVRVTYHYGAPMDLGGGEYDRQGTFDARIRPLVPFPDAARPSLTLQQAIDEVAGGGAVEIRTNNRLSGGLAIRADAGKTVEVRAADGRWPVLDLTGGAEIRVSGDGATVTLNGLLIVGGPLVVRAAGAPGPLERLRLRHCTLLPAAPGGAPLVVETPGTTVEIDHCIVGGVRAADGVPVTLADSIVDAGSPSGMAFAAPNNTTPGGALHVERCTVIGKVTATVIDPASNTIFLAEPASGDPAGTAPVRAERLQQGCVRYCYLPPNARVPRRFGCQPADPSDTARIHPIFPSLRYGDPAYCQLALNCRPEISTGADDGSEMGVYHDVYQPQRETNLRVRLDEFLRFSLEAGIFYVT
jgi:hypothetical protein